jgi:hypothetical protein
VAIFRSLASRVQVLLITHDPHVAEACDRVIVLQSTVADEPHPPTRAVRSRRWRVAAFVASAAVLLAGGTAFAAATLATHHPQGQAGLAATRSATPAASRANSPAAGPAAAASSQATERSPAPAVAGGRPTEPDGVVIAFFDAINKHDWPRVWALGGKNLGTPYRQMVQGFAGTSHDDVTITSTQSDSVSVFLVALREMYDVDVSPDLISRSTAPATGCHRVPTSATTPR